MLKLYCKNDYSNNDITISTLMHQLFFIISIFLFHWLASCLSLLVCPIFIYLSFCMQTHTQAYIQHTNTNYSFVYMLFNLNLSAHTQTQLESKLPNTWKWNGSFQKSMRQSVLPFHLKKNYVRRTSQKSNTQPIQSAIWIDHKNLYFEQFPMFCILLQKKQRNIEEQYPFKIKPNKPFDWAVSQ